MGQNQGTDASENRSREDSGTEWKNFGGSAEDLGVKKRRVPD
jgi:hypothetical protein